MYTVEISLHRYTMPEDRSDPAERRLAVAYSSTHRTPAAASRRLAELIGGGTPLGRSPSSTTLPTRGAN